MPTRKPFIYVLLPRAPCFVHTLHNTPCYAGWPGSRSDSHVLKHSRLFQFAEEYFIPLGWYLFGDSGFALYHWLVTPYSATTEKHRVQGQPSRDFNFNHASTRVVVEQAFALLKGRFRILKLVRNHLKNTPTIIMACCMLHSFCIDKHDSWHMPRNVRRPTYVPHTPPTKLIPHHIDVVAERTRQTELV